MSLLPSCRGKSSLVSAPGSKLPGDSVSFSHLVVGVLELFFFLNVVSGHQSQEVSPVVRVFYLLLPLAGLPVPFLVLFETEFHSPA